MVSQLSTTLSVQSLVSPEGGRVLLLEVLSSCISCLSSTASSGLAFPRGGAGTMPPCLSLPAWDVSIQCYVLRTDYQHYAIVLMRKRSSFGPSTSLKLYGMSAYGPCGQAGSGGGNAAHKCHSRVPRVPWP